MRAYPLIRRKWSNEHIMAALFGVLILYLIPRWMIHPGEVPGFLAALAVALVLDSAADFIHYRRHVCSVSAAVTAGILQVMTPGIPLWGRLIGVGVAILVGKSLWGGTGKNTLNPAIVGYLTIYFLFGGGYAPIVPSFLLIPALLLSLPFFTFRPFASIGLMSGMAAAMLIAVPSVGLETILVNGIFFGCIVITDPVTTTPLKIPGFAGAFAVGFLPLQIVNPALNFALSILIFNLLSYLIEDIRHFPIKRFFYRGPVLKTIAGDIAYDRPALDLTGDKEFIDTETPSNTKQAHNQTEFGYKPNGTIPLDQLIDSIASNDVYGCGGAAFPTAEKIRTVAEAPTQTKYLIINGVECDPGLIHDKWLLRNKATELCKGIDLLKASIGFSEVILTAKDISGLSYPASIRLQKVGNHYPAGYERFLVETVLKRKLPEGTVPAKEGILVMNVQTLLKVYEAVILNQRADCKYITVSDIKSGKASVVKVKAGDSIVEILEKVYPGKQPVFTGGGAMQAVMADEASTVEQGTNFIAVSAIPRYKESPLCSNCGGCEISCPSGLRVNRIADLVDEGKMDETGRYAPEKCIKCGICSYVCLSGRNLSARVSEARTQGMTPRAS